MTAVPSRAGHNENSVGRSSRLGGSSGCPFEISTSACHGERSISCGVSDTCDQCQDVTGKSRLRLQYFSRLTGNIKYVGSFTQALYSTTSSTSYPLYYSIAVIFCTLLSCDCPSNSHDRLLQEPTCVLSQEFFLQARTLLFFSSILLACTCSIQCAL